MLKDVIMAFPLLPKGKGLGKKAFLGELAGNALYICFTIETSVTGALSFSFSSKPIFITPEMPDFDWYYKCKYVQI